MLGIELAADPLEALAHGTGGIGARGDFRGDSPNQRHQRRGSNGDQSDACVAAGVVANAVGDKKSRAESNRDLRETHDAGNREVFAEFVQGEL